MNKTKLELTWIGKDKRPKLEPRILLENPGLSYHAKFRRYSPSPPAPLPEGEGSNKKTLTHKHRPYRARRELMKASELHLAKNPDLIVSVVAIKRAVQNFCRRAQTTGTRMNQKALHHAPDVFRYAHRNGNR